tara:strand:+ start:120582 stop:121451 length:870 start_codon:yes stop_codon:yes gene_type:complete
LVQALRKSPIPRTHIFEVKTLKEAIFDPNWHFHSEYQLFLVLNGTGTRFIGDNVKHFKNGDITFTGPNLPHLWRSDNEGIASDKSDWSEGIVVYFHENFIGSDLLEKEEMIKLKQLFRKSLRGIDIYGETAEKVNKMLQNLLRLQGFDSVLELLKILNCLSKTNEFEVLASPGYTNTLKEGDTERMNNVYAYIMKNFKKKIAIAELASLTNMTPTSFSRYFKVHSNKTFSDFISEIRIGHACKLLIEKRVNISHACYESGFQTMSNFNRQFKAITNRTPAAYRKEYAMR